MLPLCLLVCYLKVIIIKDDLKTIWVYKEELMVVYDTPIIEITQQARVRVLFSWFSNHVQYYLIVQQQFKGS